MAHCVKVVLDDACAKSLQQEEALHSAGDTSVTMSPTTGRASTTSGVGLEEDTSNTCSEREIPKMIAKVLVESGMDGHIVGDKRVPKVIQKSFKQLDATITLFKKKISRTSQEHYLFNFRNPKCFVIANSCKK